MLSAGGAEVDSGAAALEKPVLDVGSLDFSIDEDELIIDNMLCLF